MMRSVLRGMSLWLMIKVALRRGTVGEFALGGRRSSQYIRGRLQGICPSLDLVCEVFGNLGPRFQIPNDIPIRKAYKRKNCYTGDTEDTGFYKATFIVGLRLPLSDIYHQLADCLGISICQIALNAWRIFIGAEVLWGQMNGGRQGLSLNKFFYCYKPQEISASKGFYNFVIRKPMLKLISDMLDSNRYWKNRYFFVEGTNQVYKPDEWDGIGEGYNNTQGIMAKSSESSVFTYLFYGRRALLYLLLTW